ncbi:MAG: hypothetical protein ACM3YE_06865, partial [Bacteroidota bacterium]
MKVLKPKGSSLKLLLMSPFISFQKLKISKQIIVTFFIMISFLIVLLTVNIWSSSQISKANQQLIKAFTDRESITELKNTSSKRALQVDSLRRLAQNDIPLQIKDDNQISLIATEFEVILSNSKVVIDSLAPEKYTELNNLGNEVVTNCKAWENDKKIANLYYISSALNRLQFFVNGLAVDLNELIDANVKAAKDQIKNIQIYNIILNILVLSILMIIIIPLINNIRKLFAPVHRSADNAVQGAINAFEYAAQITESIAELKHVLIEISRSISDVSMGAQDSSDQAEKIIGSIQITSDLVVELGEIAQTVYKNLDANQINLQEKIAQVTQLSDNVSQSLTMINQNADIAAKLATQVNNLEDQMEG